MSQDKIKKTNLKRKRSKAQSVINNRESEQTRSSSIELKELPKNSNCVKKLYECFHKFGKIIKIEVEYKNHPQAALITFRQPAEAKRAFLEYSSRPLFNIKEIKIILLSINSGNESDFHTQENEGIILYSFNYNFINNIFLKNVNKIYLKIVIS